MFKFSGRAYVFGDDINTDYIIASRRKRDTTDLKVLSRNIMEDIRPGFGLQVKQGDILVAGKNFGCGSAMEQASLVILAAGMPVVIAKTFARTFYRNGINGGLVLVRCNTDKISDGDILEIELTSEKTTVFNRTRMEEIPAEGIPGKLLDFLLEGGLISYFNKYESL